LLLRQAHSVLGKIPPEADQAILPAGGPEKYIPELQCRLKLIPHFTHMGDLLGNLGINGKLLFAQVVNFLIIFALLGKFVFPKVIKFIEERKKKIAEGLELTEKAEQEMQRINDSRSRELEKARQEGEALISKAKTDAENRGAELVGEAKGQAEGIAQQARADAELAKTDAVKGAKEEVGKTALLLAEKVLSRNLTKEDEERMTNEVIEELDKKYA